MKKNVLEYKGYITKVQYDVQRQVLYGKVDGIIDSVDFESPTTDGAATAFKDSVNRYLAFCSNVGRRPAKPYKGQFSLRMQPKYHKEMAIWAATHDTTLNAAMELAAKQFLERENNKTDCE
ncbi:MAG: type II toxin-antitoxin system HicB family antitoxin [Peptococcaceae bacterium]|nr:type II toxin-antitoxin system HicB family antitoxin [Peptococcaceae bacterium]